MQNESKYANKILTHGIDCLPSVPRFNDFLRLSDCLQATPIFGLCVLVCYMLLENIESKTYYGHYMALMCSKAMTGDYETIN